MALEIGLYVESQEGVTWRDWRRIANRAEALGFDLLVASVHLWSLQEPGRWALDVWPVLTAVALWTRRLLFGPMVLPVTFYSPVQIARLSAGLDRLSGGRFRLDLGAGRDAGEHRAFGLPFVEHDERVAMMEEAIGVIRLLWSGEPVTFQGRWYRLDGGQLQPTPLVHWIGVGGDSEASLRVAATRADGWCTAGPTLPALRERLDRLDALCRQAGRAPGSLRRRIMSGVVLGRQAREIERRVRRLEDLIPALRGRSPRDALKTLTDEWRWWAGTPMEVVDQVEPFARTGVDGIVFQLFDVRDVGMLDLLGREVVPRLRTVARGVCPTR